MDKKTAVRKNSCHCKRKILPTDSHERARALLPKDRERERGVNDSRSKTRISRASGVIPSRSQQEPRNPRVADKERERRDAHTGQRKDSSNFVQLRRRSALEPPPAESADARRTARSVDRRVRDAERRGCVRLVRRPERAVSLGHSRPVL